MIFMWGNIVIVEVVKIGCFFFRGYKKENDKSDFCKISFVVI